MKVEAREVDGRKVYTVRAFNSGIARWLNRLPTLWIEGEVTELRRQQRWASVFFTLKDHSKESVEAFVALCDKYLTKHDGTKYYSLGLRAEDSDEPVSVKDFDVALHAVFESKAACEKYLKSERHVDFVSQVKDKFEKVRVFDSYLIKP